MEPPRPQPYARGPVDQGHTLVVAQGARAPDDRPARHARRSPDRQPPPLPRLPAARGTAAALPPARPHARARAPRRLAGLGSALTAAAVRPPRAHAARAPQRHPRRDPPRPLQRPPRGPQLKDPPDQPPRLRLPRARPPDRARLPLLRRHHHRAPTMNFTPNSDEAPDLATPVRLSAILGRRHAHRRATQRSSRRCSPDRARRP